MKGITAVIQTMYDHITGSPLKTAINGDVYKGQRPLNSALEDIVINALPITAAQLQRCVVNVNIHVPDIPVAYEAGEETVGNYERLEELEAIALDALDEYQSLTHSFFLQQAHMFKDNESKTHYLNIRIEFFSPNLNLN